MSVGLLQVHHVGTVVQDLEASIAWYGQHFEFERLHDYTFPGARVAFIGRGDLRLELFQIDGSAPVVPERQEVATNLKIGGINHFAIAVADLEQSVAELRADGVEIASPPADLPDGRGDRFAFVRDSEGMLVELFQPAG